VRWLAAFAPVRAPAGGTVRVEIPLPARAFAYWQDGWQYEDGSYGLQVGTSVLDLPLDASIDLLRAGGEGLAPRGRAR
jgi:beta-glucosidase